MKQGSMMNSKDREELLSKVISDFNDLSHHERLLKTFMEQNQLKVAEYLCRDIEELRQRIVNQYFSANDSLLPCLKDEQWSILLNFVIDHCSLKTLHLILHATQQLIRRTSKNRAQSLLDDVFLEQCHKGIYPEVINLFQEQSLVSPTLLLELTRERCDARSKYKSYVVTMTDSTELDCLNYYLYARLTNSTTVNQYSDQIPVNLLTVLKPSKRGATYGLPGSGQGNTLTFSSAFSGKATSSTSSSSFSFTANGKTTKSGSFFLYSGQYQHHNKMIRMKNQRRVDEYLWDLFCSDNRLLIHRLLFQPWYYPVDYWPSQEAIDRIFIAAGYRHNVSLMYMLLNGEDIHHSALPPPRIAEDANRMSSSSCAAASKEDEGQNDRLLSMMTARQATRRKLLFPSQEAYEKAFQNAIDHFLQRKHNDLGRIQWYFTGECALSNSGENSCRYHQFAYRPRVEAIVHAFSTMLRNDAKERITKTMSGRRFPNMMIRQPNGNFRLDLGQLIRAELKTYPRSDDVATILHSFCDEKIKKSLQEEKEKLDAMVRQMSRMQSANNYASDIHSFSATTVDTSHVGPAEQVEVQGDEEVLRDVEELLNDDGEGEDGMDEEEQDGLVPAVTGQGHESVHKRKTLNQAVLQFVEDKISQANIPLFEENRQVDEQLKELVDTFIDVEKRGEAHKRLDNMLRRRSIRRRLLRNGRREERDDEQDEEEDIQDNEGANEDDEVVTEDEKAFDMFNTILTYLNHFHPQRRESWIIGFMEESIEARSCLAGALERAVTGLRCIEDEEINRFFGQVEAKNLINLFLTKKMNIFQDNHGRSSSSSGGRRLSSKEELCNILASRYQIHAQSQPEVVRAALLDYMHSEVAAYQVDVHLYQAEIEATADVITDCFDMLIPYLPAQP